MKRYIGYIRVSTTEQVEGYGLDAQKSSINSYCQAMGYKLDRIVSDEGISGSTLTRPGIQEVIESMKQCQYDGVIVYKLDRISRNLKDILVLHDDIFTACGASIISVQEQFDTQTPMGKLMFQMIGGFAEFEREIIKERMFNGRVERAKQGKFAGGSAPYGYDLANGQLVINEQESSIVRRVFDLHEQGNNLQVIADALNTESAPTKRGGSWSRKHIKTMLDREGIYRGMYKHGNVSVKGEHTAIL